jgi:type IV secretory pathway protease TraF
MASKRKMRRVSQHHRAAIERIHDRRSADLPINAMVAPITVDDPYGTETGEKIVVFRSLRDDPIGAMHARGQVEEWQYTAARHWQKLHAIAGIGGARAIDTTRDAVDGGQIASTTITDMQCRALAELSKASRALGLEGVAIVRDILGRGMPLLHAAAARFLSSERELIYFGRRFRESLDTLSVVFGFAPRTQPLDKATG